MGVSSSSAATYYITIIKIIIITVIIIIFQTIALVSPSPVEQCKACWLKSCCGDLVSEKKIRTSKFVCFQMGDISEVGASFTYLYFSFLFCNMSKQILPHRNHHQRSLKDNFFQTQYLDKPADSQYLSRQQK